ncbi:MAG: hypothetical protein ISR90_01360 [Candidatus Marinimicrobia bacterium]|nr:hypothetical protein [Candidatus Neomarinimicrobiota bacterium]
MALWQQGVLLLTGLIAIYMIKFFVDQQKNEGTAGTFNIYYMISFAVLLVSGLLLIFNGWDILGLFGEDSQPSKFVAIVAGLIPFSLAIGLVMQYYPEHGKNTLIFFIVGLLLIATTKYAYTTPPGWGKIVYPLFHAIAGFTIFFLPLFASKAGKAPAGFYNVTIGGTIIGIGGIALAFIMNGKQLLFFSADFVSLILAPVLFLTALFFMLGFTKK